MSSDPPLEEVSSLASRGFSRLRRAAGTGRPPAGTGTCCRGPPSPGRRKSSFLTRVFWGQGSCAGTTNLITHLQSLSWPYLAPFLGGLGGQATRWPCPGSHYGGADSCNPPLRGANACRPQHICSENEAAVLSCALKKQFASSSCSLKAKPHVLNAPRGASPSQGGLVKA